MYNISFIVPCGRIPFKNAGKITVDSILEYHPNAEILVCSKEKINYKNVIYIEEESNNIGCVGPVNKMASLAKGDFISMINDDHYLNNHNIYPALDYIVENNLMGVTLYPYNGIGTGVGKCPFYCSTQSSWLDVIVFPLVRKKLIEENGWLLYNKLKHYYADNALSVLLWKKYNQDKFVFDNGQIYVMCNKAVEEGCHKELPGEFNIYTDFIKSWGV